MKSKTFTLLFLSLFCNNIKSEEITSADILSINIAKYISDDYDINGAGPYIYGKIMSGYALPEFTQCEQQMNKLRKCLALKKGISKDNIEEVISKSKVLQDWIHEEMHPADKTYTVAGYITLDEFGGVDNVYYLRNEAAFNDLGYDITTSGLQKLAENTELVAMNRLPEVTNSFDVIYDPNLIIPSTFQNSPFISSEVDIKNYLEINNTKMGNNSILKLSLDYNFILKESVYEVNPVSLKIYSEKFDQIVFQKEYSSPLSHTIDKSEVSSVINSYLRGEQEYSYSLSNYQLSEIMRAEQSRAKPDLLDSLNEIESSLAGGQLALVTDLIAKIPVEESIQKKEDYEKIITFSVNQASSVAIESFKNGDSGKALKYLNFAHRLSLKLSRKTIPLLYGLQIKSEFESFKNIDSLQAHAPTLSVGDSIEIYNGNVFSWIVYETLDGRRYKVNLKRLNSIGLFEDYLNVHKPKQKFSFVVQDDLTISLVKSGDIALLSRQYDEFIARGK